MSSSFLFIFAYPVLLPEDIQSKYEDCNHLRSCEFVHVAERLYLICFIAKPGKKHTLYFRNSAIMIYMNGSRILMKATNIISRYLIAILNTFHIGYRISVRIY